MKYAYLIEQVMHTLSEMLENKVVTSPSTTISKKSVEFSIRLTMVQFMQTVLRSANLPIIKVVAHLLPRQLLEIVNSEIHKTGVVEPAYRYDLESDNMLDMANMEELANMQQNDPMETDIEDEALQSLTEITVVQCLAMILFTAQIQTKSGKKSLGLSEDKITDSDYTYNTSEETHILNHSKWGNQIKPGVSGTSWKLQPPAGSEYSTSLANEFLQIHNLNRAHTYRATLAALAHDTTGK